MLCITFERFHIHLGRRKCRSKVRPLLWIHRCLVVLHRVDDLRGRQLSSMSDMVCFDIYLNLPVDDCKLYRIPTCGLGCRFPRRDWKRQREVACSYMGSFRGRTRRVHRHQLSAP